MPGTTAASNSPCRCQIFDDRGRSFEFNDGPWVQELCIALTDMPGLQYLSLAADVALVDCQDGSGPGGWLWRLPGGFHCALLTRACMRAAVRNIRTCLLRAGSCIRDVGTRAASVEDSQLVPEHHHSGGAVPGPP